MKQRWSSPKWKLKDLKNVPRNRLRVRSGRVRGEND